MWDVVSVIDIIDGMGSVLGAITLAVLPESFAKLPGEWGAPMIFYGAALMLVIMFMPQDIAGWVHGIRYRLSLRKLGTPPRLTPAAPDPVETSNDRQAGRLP